MEPATQHLHRSRLAPRDLRNSLAAVALGLALVAAFAGALAASTAPAQTPAPGAAAPAGVRRPPLTVTHLANAGVLLAAGDRRLIIDGLFGEGLPDYPAVSPARRVELERGGPPFAGIDAVLATHAHRDHFDAEAVARHLRANPHAVFVGGAEAQRRVRETAGGEELAARLRGGAGTTVEVAPGLVVKVLALPHGPTRNPAENVALLVSLAGHQVLHVGDAAFDDTSVDAAGIPALRLDLAILPYWFFLGDDSRATVRRAVRARRILLVHAPSGESRWPQLRAAAGEGGAEVVVPSGELTSATLD
jgi:L-ascorbate metabolism protein UlaG (beta-lactamase superfamily)